MAWRKRESSKRPAAFRLFSCRGFSLVEMLIAMAIFSILMSGIYSAFSSQMGHLSREYRVAEADMEHLVAKNVIERDIQMAGYGFAEDFGGATGFTPPARTVIVRSSDPNNPDNVTSPDFPDVLLLYGTALGLQSRQAQKWSYRNQGQFNGLNDLREDLSINDGVIVIESNTKKLLRGGGATNDWLFRFNGWNNPLVSVNNAGGTFAPPDGALLYGLHGASTTALQPYYAVRYALAAGDPGGICAPDTRNLLRDESDSTNLPGPNNPLLNCVLDFQVAFGLDTNEDGGVDLWSDGGAAAGAYTAAELRKRLKQVRAYLLVQASNQESGYTYPNATVRVGESSALMNTGRDITLTDEQRRYRWRLLTLSVAPRNLR